MDTLHDPEAPIDAICEMSWLRESQCAHCQGHIDRRGNVIEA